MSKNWAAPFPWTIVDNGLVISQANGSRLPAYIFARRETAEAWVSHLRERSGRTVRAVPLPDFEPAIRSEERRS